MDSSRTLPIQIKHSGIIRENTVKKKGQKSASGKCSGDSSIQLRVKAIVESPAYGLAASADLSTSGTARKATATFPAHRNACSYEEGP